MENDNKGFQQDSQSHTRHVCDATYPAILVTYACGSADLNFTLTRSNQKICFLQNNRSYKETLESLARVF